MASFRSYVLKRYISIGRAALKSRLNNHRFLRWLMDRGAERISMPSGVAVESLEVSDAPAFKLIPEGADQDKVLLYFHGGGYAVGSIHSHKSMAAKIAQEAGITSLIVTYRLAPEHVFPAALEDAVASYQYLLDTGYLPENIAIGGDSAGGGLMLALLVKLKELELPQPALGIGICPWADLSGSGESIKTKAKVDPMISEKELREWAAMYAAEAGVEHPLVSPVYADLSGIAPLFIQMGTDELLLDDAHRLKANAERDGIEIEVEIWEDMFHVWHYFWRYIPEGTKAIRAIADQIKSRLNVKAKELAA